MIKHLSIFDAIKSSDLELVKSLIQSGVNVNYIEVSGWTPLYLASYLYSHKYRFYRDLDILELLIKSGADVNYKVDFLDCTSLFHTLLSDSIMTLLLENGADPNVKNSYGDTCLHKAALYSCPGNMKLLVRSGADIDSQNYKGNTPLHIAALYGYGISPVRTLIQLGANTAIENLGGETALDLAKDPEIRACIQRGRIPSKTQSTHSILGV
jgi:ankyrin repeat protein